MCRNTLRRLVAVTALAAVGCTDRPAAPAPDDISVARTAAPLASSGPPEALARALARALRSPALRAQLNALLDASPHREHKVQFQGLLHANGQRLLQAVAAANAVSPATLAGQAGSAIPLELYLPVPAHRAAWRGDGRVLVATAIGDHEIPVAFDTAGTRYLLSPDVPPATPVLALVPVESDFSTLPVGLAACPIPLSVPLSDPPPSGTPSCGGGGIDPPSAPPPGLYLTQAHFTQTFEGWLKGSPEFEVHILGQKGQTDSLTDYQCAGEKQPSPFYFDQNDLDWSGSVMLFSQTALNNYKTAHPNQNVRVYVVEDDDTACQIKTEPTEFERIAVAVDDANRALTAGKDSIMSWKFAKALLKFLSAVGSLINTNDELVGNAVQDSIATEFHPGFNWIVKGEQNVTNGWIKLEMR